MALNDRTGNGNFCHINGSLFYPDGHEVLQYGLTTAVTFSTYICFYGTAIIGGKTYVCVYPRNDLLISDWIWQHHLWHTSTFTKYISQRM